MGPLFLFLLILALVFVLITVHETGHFVAGWMGGIPARDMKLVLWTFPQHVAVRDGEEWVSPVRDIRHYIEITRRHLSSRGAAFRWVAGGMALELAFTASLWSAAMGTGYRAVAFWAACVSLGMYAINVGLMDLPWALRYRCAAGDTSGLWQIAPVPAVLFTAVMVASRVVLVVLSAELGAAPSMKSIASSSPDKSSPTSSCCHDEGAPSSMKSIRCARPISSTSSVRLFSPKGPKVWDATPLRP
jgi:hypothetical protein